MLDCGAVARSRPAATGRSARLCAAAGAERSKGRVPESPRRETTESGIRIVFATRVAAVLSSLAVSPVPHRSRAHPAQENIRHLTEGAVTADILPGSRLPAPGSWAVPSRASWDTMHPSIGAIASRITPIAWSEFEGRLWDGGIADGRNPRDGRAGGDHTRRIQGPSGLSGQYGDTLRGNHDHDTETRPSRRQPAVHGRCRSSGRYVHRESRGCWT